MWTTIVYLLLLIPLLGVLWYLFTPKKECFTVVLKSGVSWEGHIRYRGDRDEHAMRAEIIDKVRMETPDEEVAQIYLG